MTSGKRGKSLTVICAINSAETNISPMFINPRKRIVATLVKNAPAAAFGPCTDNEWTDEKFFLKWLMYFSNISIWLSEEILQIIYWTSRSQNSGSYGVLQGKGN